jgi:hypothetical protein
MSLCLVVPSSVLTGTVLGSSSHWEGSRWMSSHRFRDYMTIYVVMTCSGVQPGMHVRVFVVTDGDTVWEVDCFPEWYIMGWYRR